MAKAFPVADRRLNMAQGYGPAGKKGKETMDEVRFLTAGESAVVVEFGKTINDVFYRKVRMLLDTLDTQPIVGVVDAVPSFRSLLVCFDPERIERGRLAGLLLERCKKLPAREGEDRVVIEVPVCYGARFGADFQAVSEQAGLVGDELSALHCGQDYRVYMFGGLPGFAYLGGLEERLILPKPERAGKKIPMGSICIQKEHTALYPMDAPGDWWVIGATPVCIYDAGRERPFLYEAGEYLRFVRVAPFEYYDIRRMVELGEYRCRVTKNGVECGSRDAGTAQKKGNMTVDMGVLPPSVLQGNEEKENTPGAGTFMAAAREEAQSKRGQDQKIPARGKASRKQKKNAGKTPEPKRGCFEILTPGMLTTVQDYGRFGYQRYGISVSGAMDFVSYAFANALVGNVDGAAALECTMVGPAFTVRENMVIAVTGADMQPSVNGEPVPMNEAVRLRRGDEVTLGVAKYGCRTYLAVSGGIDVTPTFGSRSTHVRSGVGGYQGRRLMAGDVLFAGLPERAQEAKKVGEKRQGTGGQHQNMQVAKVPEKLKEASLAAVAAGTQDIVTLRVVQGPQKEYFTMTGEQVFFSEVYHLTENCDRTGYQLGGTRVMTVSGVEIVPDGIALGAVQISPAGRPIIMLSDRPVVGGYAKFGTVVRDDIPKLAQLRPGTAVRFERVELG